MYSTHSMCMLSQPPPPPPRLHRSTPCTPCVLSAYSKYTTEIPEAFCDPLRRRRQRLSVVPRVLQRIRAVECGQPVAAGTHTRRAFGCRRCCCCCCCLCCVCYALFTIRLELCTHACSTHCTWSPFLPKPSCVWCTAYNAHGVIG